MTERRHYDVAPIQLVVALVGAVALVTAAGMVVIAIVAALYGNDVPDSIPNPLATTCIASLTGLSGLLTPNTGLTTSARAARHAAVAGQAAAAAVVEHEQLHDLVVEANGLSEHTERKHDGH